MINIEYIFEDNNSQTITYHNKEINIQTISSFKDFETFYNFSLELHKENPLWVAPFFKEYKKIFQKKNPFWNHSECKLFIAKKNNKVVGRIAAIIDHRFCETVREKIGYFGFFDCIEDFECSEALLKSAQDWLVSNNMTIMRGPIDGRIDIGFGFLYNKFDSESSFFSPYTPKYYISFMKKFKMEKIRDFTTYYVDLTKPLPAQLKEKAKQCIEFGVTIRPFSRLHKKRELKWWIKLFLETFEDHWGYVPASYKEVKSRFGIEQLRWIVDPKLFLIAEYNGSPVAYLWSTPDYNQIFKKMNGNLGPYQLFKFITTKNRIKKGKLLLIGIKKELRIKYIGSCLNYKVLIEMKKCGYTGAEIGPVDEKNDSAHKTIVLTGAKVYKKYRVFEKKIGQKKANKKGL